MIELRQFQWRALHELSLISLGSITRPGSLGIISARFTSTPLRRGKSMKRLLYFSIFKYLDQLSNVEAV